MRQLGLWGVTEMLSEEDMNKIREEEIYREEIKSALKDSEERHFLISFLNTQHGIFISSAIILPFILWFFSFIQFHYSSATEERDLIKIIDYEISFRISNYYNMLDEGNLIGFKTEIDDRYVFPQFQGVGIQGLILQLEGLVTDKDKQEIITARTSLISGNNDDIKTNLKIRGWVIE